MSSPNSNTPQGRRAFSTVETRVSKVLEVPTTTQSKFVFDYTGRGKFEVTRDMKKEPEATIAAHSGHVRSLLNGFWNMLLGYDMSRRKRDQNALEELHIERRSDFELVTVTDIPKEAIPGLDNRLIERYHGGAGQKTSHVSAWRF